MSPSFDPANFAGLASLQLKARYVMEGFLHGIHGSPFHGPSVEFNDYRDYQPGDDLRHLDWRLYARNDRLAIKRFEKETNARGYLLCDTSASMTYRGERAWGSKLDCARILSVALGWFLLRQNDAVGLFALDGAPDDTESVDPSLFYLQPSQKRSQLGRLMGAMEGLRPSGAAHLVSLLNRASEIARRRSLVILFSDLLDPADDVTQAFKRLRFDGHDCVVVQILDPDEIDFPFQDGTVFEDLETQERRQLADSSVRDRYLERFAAFMESHRQLFRELEIPYAVLRTDEDPGVSLARLLTARSTMA